jgi:hypothetical protein
VTVVEQVWPDSVSFSATGHQFPLKTSRLYGEVPLNHLKATFKSSRMVKDFESDIQELHQRRGVLRSLEGESMLLGKFSLAIFLMTAPVWAQYSRADMTKLAADRFDAAVRTLNLRSDQADAIRPLLLSEYVGVGQVKDVYVTSAKSDASNKSADKKTAQESLRAIDAKYNAQITAILTPEQAKAWKRMQKDWKSDFIVPKS